MSLTNFSIYRAGHGRPQRKTLSPVFPKNYLYKITWGTGRSCHPWPHHRFAVSRDSLRIQGFNQFPMWCWCALTFDNLCHVLWSFCLDTGRVQPSHTPQLLFRLALFACSSVYHRVILSCLAPRLLLSPYDALPCPHLRLLASQAANFRRGETAHCLQKGSSWTGPQRGSNVASSSPVPHPSMFLPLFPLVY